MQDVKKGLTFLEKLCCKWHPDDDIVADGETCANIFLASCVKNHIDICRVDKKQADIFRQRLQCDLGSDLFWNSMRRFLPKE